MNLKGFKDFVPECFKFLDLRQFYLYDKTLVLQTNAISFVISYNELN